MEMEIVIGGRGSGTFTKPWCRGMQAIVGSAVDHGPANGTRYARVLDWLLHCISVSR
jgi:hypothetical protein